MPKQECVQVRCSFDSVTDICIMAETPNGEQFWFAGSNKVNFSVVGEYVFSMIVSDSTCESCEQIYQWQFCPLGKTADELKLYEKSVHKRSKSYSAEIVVKR